MNPNANKLIVKVEVESDFVDSRGGINAKGKPYEIHTQKAWIYLGSKFPKEFSLDLTAANQAVPPGLYEVDLMPALDIGDFGRVVVDVRKFRLLSIGTEAPKLSAAK